MLNFVIIKNYVMNIIYESPEIIALDVMTEGVLCVSSSGTDMNPEFGNM